LGDSFCRDGLCRQADDAREKDAGRRGHDNFERRFSGGGRLNGDLTEARKVRERDGFSDGAEPIFIIRCNLDLAYGAERCGVGCFLHIMPLHHERHEVDDAANDQHRHDKRADRKKRHAARAAICTSCAPQARLQIFPDVVEGCAPMLSNSLKCTSKLLS
jgi:hypothetical protein